MHSSSYEQYPSPGLIKQKHTQKDICLKIKESKVLTCLASLLFIHLFILQVRFKDRENSTKEIAALIKGRYKDQSGTCECHCP